MYEMEDNAYSWNLETYTPWQLTNDLNVTEFHWLKCVCAYIFVFENLKNIEVRENKN